MLYPPVADLLKNVDSRYLLVNLVATVHARLLLKRKNSRKICLRSP